MSDRGDVGYAFILGFGVGIITMAGFVGSILNSLSAESTVKRVEENKGIKGEQALKGKNHREEYEEERIKSLRAKIQELTRSLDPSDYHSRNRTNQELITKLQKELDIIYESQEKRKVESEKPTTNSVACLVCQNSLSSNTMVCPNCTAAVVLDYNRTRAYNSTLYPSTPHLYSNPQPQ